MRRRYANRDIALIKRRLEVFPLESEGPLDIQFARTIDTYHAIERLLGCITELQEFGLTLRQIAVRLTDMGFPIRERTLRSYVRRARRPLSVPPSLAEAQSTPDDSTPLDFDIEVVDEPVVDQRFEHWFRKG